MGFGIPDSGFRMPQGGREKTATSLKPQGRPLLLAIFFYNHPAQSGRFCPSEYGFVYHFIDTVNGSGYNECEVVTTVEERL